MSKTHRILTPRLIFFHYSGGPLFFLKQRGAPMVCIGFIALSEALVDECLQENMGYLGLKLVTMLDL